MKILHPKFSKGLLLPNNLAFPTTCTFFLLFLIQSSYCKNADPKAAAASTNSGPISSNKNGPEVDTVWDRHGPRIRRGFKFHHSGSHSFGGGNRGFMHSRPVYRPIRPVYVHRPLYIRPVYGYRPHPVVVVPVGGGSRREGGGGSAEVGWGIGIALIVIFLIVGVCLCICCLSSRRRDEVYIVDDQDDDVVFLPDDVVVPSDPYGDVVVTPGGRVVEVEGYGRSYTILDSGTSTGTSTSTSTPADASSVNVHYSGQKRRRYSARTHPSAPLSEEVRHPYKPPSNPYTSPPPPYSSNVQVSPPPPAYSTLSNPYTPPSNNVTARSDSLSKEASDTYAASSNGVGTSSTPPFTPEPKEV